MTATPELAAFAAPSFPQGRPWLDGVLDLMGRIYSGFTFQSHGHQHQHAPFDRAADEAWRVPGLCPFANRLPWPTWPAGPLRQRLLAHVASTWQAAAGGGRCFACLALGLVPRSTGWIDFDPTNNVVPSLGHITVAWGRDYSDVCPIQGVFIGGGQHSMPQFRSTWKRSATNGNCRLGHAPGC